jgi:hypothetical protein
MQRSERGEGSSLPTIIVGILVLPVLIGALSTGLFLWRCSSAQEHPPVAPAVELRETLAAPRVGFSCPGEEASPCAATLAAFDAAAKADLPRLRAHLAEGDWVDRLPEVGVSSSAEKGVFLTLMLVGRKPGTREELLAPPLVLTSVETSTALDGQSASLVVAYEQRRAAGTATGSTTLAARRIDGVWTLAPPAP